MRNSLEILSVRLEAALSGWGSKSELCRKAGISSSQLATYLDRKSAPTIDVLDRIAESLGTTPDALLAPLVAGVPAVPREIVEALARCDEREMNLIRTALQTLGKLEPARAQKTSKRPL